MVSPPDPSTGADAPSVERLLARARGGSAPLIVTAAPYVSLAPLLEAASAAGAVIVNMPRTALADPFAPLWSALGHRLPVASPDLPAALDEVLDSRLLVITDLDRAAAEVVDLVLALDAHVLATSTRTGTPPGFEHMTIPGWGNVRDVPAVDHQDALDALRAADAAGVVPLLADWIARGEPSSASDGLAAHAASVATTAELVEGTRRAVDAATAPLRVTLLHRLDDPRAGAEARSVLESSSALDIDLATRVVLHRLAASEFAEDDPDRGRHLLAAAGAALVLGRHDEAGTLLDDPAIATDDHAELLRAELARRLELPDLGERVAADSHELLSDLAVTTSWLPGRVGVAPADITSMEQSSTRLVARAPTSVDLRVRHRLVRQLIHGDDPDDEGEDAPGRSGGGARDLALHRLASGIVGLHRSRPPAEVADAVVFAVDPSAGTGMSALALAHAAVALGDAGRSSEALALLDEHRASGRFAERPLPESLLRWAHAEVEFSAGRPARAARVGESTAGRPAVDGSSAWLLQVVLDWSAVETRRPALALELSDAVGIAVAAPVERAAIARFVDEEFADAVDGFLAAETLWRGRHDRGALRCAWAAGEAARLGDDLETARAILQRAEAEASHLDSLPMLSRIRQSLRRAGVRAAASRSAGIGPLSGREVDVLRLVGVGRSSIDIGVQLGVAKSTVETQISSAMLKLNAATRLQAAAMLRDLEDST